MTPLTPCDRCAEAPNPLLHKGVRLFNERHYFECHEVLEDAWNIELGRKAAPFPLTTPPDGSCANFYKGILQVGVGCLHLLRHNYRGAIIKLATGADYLEPFVPNCMTVDVARLILQARALRAAVVAAGPANTTSVDLALLPVIQLIS